MAFVDEQNQQPKKIKTSDNKTCSVPTIHNEIIVNILCRLPVKLLLRYKSVCKLWCSLISDSYLIKSHLSLSTSNSHYAHHQLILTISSFNINLLSCGLYEVMCDHKSVNVLELDHPFKRPRSSKFSEPYPELIVGSCNGLLCVAIDHHSLYIWNPSTRKSNLLPYRGRLKVWDGWSVMYGFGYDESSNDYKVVKVYYNDTYDTEVKIYSLKSGFWRKVGKFPCSPRRSKGAFGMFLNGALHWGITKQYGPSLLWTIVSLDLAKETFNEILQPVYDDSKYLTSLDTIRGFSLGVLGEWLCVLRDYLGKHADVWVMKVYGVKDSWTRLVSIPHMTITSLFQPRYSTPLYISNDGKVLLRLGSKWVMYDSKNSSVLDIQKFDGCLGAYTFVESLVSPHALEHKVDNVN
ncbi:F-box associated interaction domain-containing protein [Artemisia annua]|uniref:F-box associated interaction domain-containing protein n=1 Tax=Artemisia annua TaxID=35608 RepID=A0A2U1PT01_ARTAN|nr:F-box associated interaction domain-containing protein [Artemisia annua]